MLSEKPETLRPPMNTMNLLTNMENPTETVKENAVGESANVKFVGFLPQFVGFGTSSSINEDVNRADFRCATGAFIYLFFNKFLD